MKTIAILFRCTAFFAVANLLAADAPAPAAPKKVDPFAGLFADEVVAKGKGFEVKRSEVDEAWTAFKANAAARGQPVRETQEMAERTLIDRIIVVKMMIAHAIDADKAKGRERADKVLTGIKASTSPENFERQLKSLGSSAAKFWEQLLERAVCEEVMEREVQGGVKIGDEEVKKFYETNSARFMLPERVRASHILFSTRDSQGGAELPTARRVEIRSAAEKVLARARAGEDFATLVKDYSDDEPSKAKGGEYTFARGQMVPEFEAAAFSLAPAQVSDLVSTQYGYHLIKLAEKLPAEKLAFEKVSERIREGLVMAEVEQRMPAYLEKLKTDAQVEYLTGAGKK
ncbi:MAG: peptidylprolyl isomerase [Verrucomicrobia bacterium]|nr:peptidylprolyl isomerase [Verrucomicrobiota bacterium]